MGSLSPERPPAPVRSWTSAPRNWSKAEPPPSPPLGSVKSVVRWARRRQQRFATGTMIWMWFGMARPSAAGSSSLPLPFRSGRNLSSGCVCLPLAGPPNSDHPGVAGNAAAGETRATRACVYQGKAPPCARARVTALPKATWPGKDGGPRVLPRLGLGRQAGRHQSKVIIAPFRSPSADGANHWLII